MIHLLTSRVTPHQLSEMLEELEDINIRPKQDNPSMEILDSTIRDRVNSIVKKIFGAQ
jgi:Protein of unknown function (DUF5674)